MIGILKKHSIEVTHNFCFYMRLRLNNVPRGTLFRRKRMALCKRIFSALCTKFCFERHVIFMISQSEIMKMTCLSKQSFAVAGGKRLFTHLFIYKQGICLAGISWDILWQNDINNVSSLFDC